MKNLAGQSQQVNSRRFCLRIDLVELTTDEQGRISESIVRRKVLDFPFVPYRKYEAEVNSDLKEIATAWLEALCQVWSTAVEQLKNRLKAKIPINASFAMKMPITRRIRPVSELAEGGR